MGNCAGCAGPQRTYQVERLYQNSPIKSRLSNGGKYYQPSNSNIKEFQFQQKDKIVERGSFHQNQMIGGIFGLAHSKSRPNSLQNQTYNNSYTPNNLYSTNKNTYDTNNNLYLTNNNIHGTHSHQQPYGDFTKDLLTQMVRTNIKLYPDNPQNFRQLSPQLQKSFLYQKQEDLHNSRNDFFKKQSSTQSFSNQLLKSVQSESKRYLRDISSQQKISNKANESPPMEHILGRFDDISQIRGTKNNFDHQNSLPLKKNSKYNRDLTVIQQILQQDHKTPLDIRQQRKNNGQDIIFDAFEGFPDEIQPLQIPNFSQYLSVLKQISQKS